MPKASPWEVDEGTRGELIQSLLDDLTMCRAENKGRLTRHGALPILRIGFILLMLVSDAAQALLAVKTLGKQPSGSKFLSTSVNLSTLLALSKSFKDDPKASSEALRCVANALLLVEEARSNWIKADVGGGQASVELLQVGISLRGIQI